MRNKNRVNVPKGTKQDNVNENHLLKEDKVYFGRNSIMPQWRSAVRLEPSEAPLITTTPKVDGTDLYMFTSYETGRDNFVTLIANYMPLQDPGGGPNYFTLDDEAVYEIHIDNSGDAVENITFQFQFTNTNRAISWTSVNYPLRFL